MSPFLGLNDPLNQFFHHNLFYRPGSRRDLCRPSALSTKPKAIPVIAQSCSVKSIGSFVSTTASFNFIVYYNNAPRLSTSS
jgi:hypothetical protein